MDDRLSLSVTHADGRITRWGPDEVDAGSIPSDLQFGTAMPGGFRDLSCSLLRRIDLEYPDQALFDNVRAYGPGGQTAWDGRFTQFPRSHGSGFSITPGAVGWSAHLRDDPSFREVYIDRDLGRWHGPGVARQTSLIAGNYGERGFTIRPDPTSGVPGLATEVMGAWTFDPISEPWYDAGGILIGRLRASWTKNTNVSAADANWHWAAYVSEFETTGSSDTTGDLRAAGPSTIDLAATGERRFALLELWYDVAAGAEGAIYGVTWTNLRVFGNHGLTIRGTSPDDGLYASDIVEDIVSRAAPLLDTSGIEATDFVIPHLTFLDPVTAEDALSLVNSYHLWEWGVYDDRVFFYRPPDPNRLVWEARLDRGAFLDLEGDTAEQVYNGVYVSYQDSAGTRKTIGPTGASADATSSVLADTSATNPVNAHGIPRRWARLEISQPTTQAGAEQLGYVWLAEHSIPQRRGNLTLTGAATHPTEGDVPCWRIRAGDSVRISDHPADVPRRIISTSYNHGSRSMSLSLDNTSLKLDAILERMGVGLVGVL